MSMNNGEEYVVFKVANLTYNVDSASQYDHPGYDNNEVFVYPRPVKVVRNEKGEFVHEGEVITVDLDVKPHSYTSLNFSPVPSSAWAIYSNEEKKTRKMIDKGANYAKESEKVKVTYGFPIPMSEFKKSKTAAIAFKKFVAGNISQKPIKLSSDPEEAKKQLEGIGVDINLVQAKKQTNKTTR